MGAAERNLGALGAMETLATVLLTALPREALPAVRERFREQAESTLAGILKSGEVGQDVCDGYDERTHLLIARLEAM